MSVPDTLQKCLSITKNRKLLSINNCLFPDGVNKQEGEKTASLSLFLIVCSLTHSIICITVGINEKCIFNTVISCCDLGLEMIWKCLVGKWLTVGNQSALNVMLMHGGCWHPLMNSSLILQWILFLLQCIADYISSKINIAFGGSRWIVVCGMPFCRVRTFWSREFPYPGVCKKFCTTTPIHRGPLD